MNQFNKREKEYLNGWGERKNIYVVLLVTFLDWCFYGRLSCNHTFFHKYTVTVNGIQPTFLTGQPTFLSPRIRIRIFLNGWIRIRNSPPDWPDTPAPFPQHVQASTLSPWKSKYLCLSNVWCMYLKRIISEYGSFSRSFAAYK